MMEKFAAASVVKKVVEVSRPLKFSTLIVSWVLLVSALEGVALGNDGFCGFEAAQACCNQLGVTWSKASKANRLESVPIVSFAEIAEAIQEQGLHSFPTVYESKSSEQIKGLFHQLDGELVAIVRVKSKTVDTRVTGVGHFLMVYGITPTGDISTFDPINQDLGRIQNDAARLLPILLVSTSPIDVPNFFRRCCVAGLSWLASKSITCIVFTAFFLLLAHDGMRRWPVVQYSLAPKLIYSVFGFVVCIFVWFSSQPALQESQALRFTELKYELGSYKVGSIATGRAILINDGDSSLEIMQVLASCGCMEVDFQPQTILPGGKLEIRVNFTKIALGFNRYSISLVTAQGSPHCEFLYLGEPTMRLEPVVKMIEGTHGLSFSVPLSVHITVRDLVGQESPIQAVVAVSEESMLQVVDFHGEVAAEGSEIIVNLLPTKFSKTGIHFSRFRIDTHSGSEPLALFFDVGVEFREIAEIPLKTKAMVSRVVY